ncbi:MAG TPA: Rieske 2Fe-2S domain-containing protein [Candidatus Kapabacteria bacterium]|nr:Rieske 2Fe-2S domain-containing protein [Candidatus Kapabacteria bacterium]
MDIVGQQHSRRGFLVIAAQSLVGITIVGSVASIIESCGNSNPVDTGAGSDAGKTLTVDVSSLTSDNMAIHTTAPSSGRELLVVRRSSTVYETLLLVCTHSGCGYPSIDINGQQISCSCHGSRFDLTGKVTNGPAQTPLTSFATTYDPTNKKATVTF